MNDLVIHQFQNFARQHIGLCEFSGDYKTGGVWVYNHNFVNMAWKMWQECQKLNDEKLACKLSEIESKSMDINPQDVFKPNYGGERRMHGVQIDTNPLSGTYGKNVSPWKP